MANVFSSTITSDGALVVLSETRVLRAPRPIAHDAWGGRIPKSLDRTLGAMVAEGIAEPRPEGLFLPHTSVAGLPQTLADRLGMPELARVSLALQFDGRIDTPEGTIRLRWADANHRQVRPKRDGAFLRIGADEPVRLTETLYRLCEAVDGFDATRNAPIEARIAAWGPIQQVLAHATGREIAADGFMRSLTFYQAGAFALDVVEKQSGPDFTPIPMSPLKAASVNDDAPTEDVGEGGEADEPASEMRDAVADALLPAALQSKFVDGWERNASTTRDAYVLDKNVFLIIPPDLRIALDVVRAKRRAPVAERRAFLRNPRAAIAVALETTGRQVAPLFVETSQYSDRVEGLGVWTEISMPQRNGGGGWLPEEFPNRPAPKVTPDNLDEVERAVEIARAEGRDTVEIAGATVPIVELEPEIERARTERASADQDDAVPPPEPEPTPPEDEAEGPIGLTIKSNIDDVEYTIPRRPRPPLVPPDFPTARMSSNRPKAHQSEGFDWLVAAWTQGWPGVLLADDMGLGKTYQALAFLAWVRSNLEVRGRHHPTAAALGPMMVVAPTALLRNWRAEAERHLAYDGLGEVVEAFGPGLRRLKRPRDDNWTPEDALDLDMLRSADWILTTYETLADNHRAFARIPYSVLVFDEMQKIKEPGSINTRSAKTLNADFVLGLTGTPIENRIEDLWSLFDRIAPGYLGALRPFSHAYGGDDPVALARLKFMLDTPVAELPAPMLRRMKDRARDGLPAKQAKAYRVSMPKAQADAYSRVVAEARIDGLNRRGMLEILHKLRGISLHPDRADGVDTSDPASCAAWLERSARLGRAVEILRRIEALGEKAIVFVEDLAVQRAFAEAVATLMDLPRIPDIINGSVAGDRRLAIVDRFQEAPLGFDLLVLSPKAAGVGLTITAANHVLHLSRWWNPAVEDQCNDRAYRIGQTRDVTIHLPQAEHPAFGNASFDIRLDELLERKRALSRHMLAPPESDGDIDALFGQVMG